MKKLLLLVCVFVGGIQLMGQGIEFLHVGWEEAMKKAKEENKLLFVDAYAKWCGPCKAMAANVFTQKEAGDFFNANFINLKLDMEEMDGRTFGDKYPVRAYPTLFFIDGDGKMVLRVVGGQKLENLMAIANDALAKGDNIDELAMKFSEGERSYEFMMKYVKALNRAGESTIKVSNTYLSSSPDITKEQKARFLFEAASEADSKLFETMIADRAYLISLVGEEAYNARVKKACMATTDKAIEFELKMLLDEAVGKAELALTDEKSDFVAQAQMNYFRAFNESDHYLEAVSDYLKAIGTNDAAKVKSTIQEMCGTFPENQKILERASKAAKDLYKENSNFDNLLLYCNTLILSSNKKEALKEAEKAAKKMDDLDPADKSRLDLLINNLSKELN